MRTHIIIPEPLVHAVDELVGERKRSKFFVEAVEEKVKRIKRMQLAKELAGSLANDDMPEWETTEKTIAWVHNSRNADTVQRERWRHEKDSA